MFRLVSMFASSVSQEHLGAHGRRPFRSHLIFAPFNYPARSTAGPPSFLEARRTHTHTAPRDLLSPSSHGPDPSAFTPSAALSSLLDRDTRPSPHDRPVPRSDAYRSPLLRSADQWTEPRATGNTDQWRIVDELRQRVHWSGRPINPPFHSIASCRKNQRGARNEP